MKWHRARLEVLYREGKAWQTSEPVMYANDAESTTVASVIAADIARWRAQIADLVVTEGDTVKTAGGQPAEIRVFQSAGSKHYEAVACVAQEQRVWLLVLAARSLPAYRAAYPDFLKLVKSDAPGPTVKTR